MTTWFAYLIGVLLHVGFKWAGWKSRAGTAKWMDYWKRFAAINVQSAIGAVVCGFMWEQGWLALAINAAFNAQSAVNVPDLQVTFWSSLFAGYMLDSAGRTLLVMFSKRIGHDPTAEDGGIP